MAQTVHDMYWACTEQWHRQCVTCTEPALSNDTDSAWHVLSLHWAMTQTVRDMYWACTEQWHRQHVTCNEPALSNGNSNLVTPCTYVQQGYAFGCIGFSACQKSACLVLYHSKRSCWECYTTCSWNFNSSKEVFYIQRAVQTEQFTLVLIKWALEYCIKVCHTFYMYYMQQGLPPCNNSC